MNIRRAGLSALTILLLAGCGEPEEARTSLTEDEEQQLNDAAAMLDEPEEDLPANQADADDE